MYDRRDDPIDPHRGIYNTVDLGLAENAFGSQRNFGRFLARNATYHPHREEAGAGAQHGVRRDPSVQFRGQRDRRGSAARAVLRRRRQLDPRVSGGAGRPARYLHRVSRWAGTAVFFNQTELRFPLVGENIAGVFFHDMGNVYSSLGNLSFRTSQRNLQDFDYMVHAVGFGVRYRTPVGPVRLDLAYSINPPYFYGFKGTQQDLVNAGVDPCAPQAASCVVQNVSHFQFFFSIGQTF